MLALSYHLSAKSSASLLSASARLLLYPSSNKPTAPHMPPNDFTSDPCALANASTPKGPEATTDVARSEPVSGVIERANGQRVRNQTKMEKKGPSEWPTRPCSAISLMQGSLRWQSAPFSCDPLLGWPLLLTGHMFLLRTSGEAACSSAGQRNKKRQAVSSEGKCMTPPTSHLQTQPRQWAQVPSAAAATPSICHFSHLLQRIGPASKLCATSRQRQVAVLVVPRILRGCFGGLAREGQTLPDRGAAKRTAFVPRGP
jgi:hypothetical protein